MAILRLTPRAQAPLRILALGAHADDVEIGCGGTVLRLVAEHPGAEVRYVVFSASPVRSDEARAAAAELAAGASRLTVDIHDYRDSFFPWDRPVELKQTIAELRKSFEPDIVFTHHRADLHQDHALIAQLTWTAFRDHLILEYEIPKFDGDIGRPNVFVPLSAEIVEQKLALLEQHFLTQSGKHWFDRETFLGLMRLRGMEAVAPERYAEAFSSRKVVLAP
jgi:LmbE family N-acetylglucosaminyl deacetylase